MSGKNEKRFSSVDFFALAYCALSVLFLVFLLWKYVPANAALFAAQGVSLPLLTRVVIMASNWFVRLLPLMVIVGIAASVVALALGRPVVIGVGIAANVLTTVVIAAMYLVLRVPVVQIH